MPHPRLPAEFPTLRRRQVVLREIRGTDAPAWFGYLRDPRVTHVTSWDVRSVKDVERVIAETQRRFRAGMAMRWAVCTDGSDDLVGTCGFVRLEESDNRGEVGYDLAPACWGHGLMSDALAAVLSYGFEVLRLRRIEATVMVGNERSVSLLRRFGFVREGLLHDYRRARGRYRDMEVYGLVRHMRR